jgi:hypothetical protein
MKRTLLLLAAVSLFAAPAMAQTVRSTTEQRPAVAAEPRPTLDIDDLARRLRDRGVPESEIEVSMARIRYWLSLGASPARIRAFLQSQQGGDRPERPDVARPEAERPEVANVDRPLRRAVTPTRATPTIATRGAVVQRSGTAVRPLVATPRSARPAVTRPRAGN